MSIIQEALRKAQGDYFSRGIFKARISSVRQARRSLIIPLILTFSMILISALSLRTFFTHKETLPVVKAEPPKVTAEVVAPAPIIKAPEPIKVENKPAFVLNGIMHLDNRRQAIINGYILGVGDSINNATVLLIANDYVLLNAKEDKIKVDLKR